MKQLAAMLILALPITANAVPILVDCSSATILSHIQGGGGTAANGCQYVDPPDGSAFAILANINTAGGTGFFGFNDWDVAVALQDLDSGPGLSGSWNIPGYDSSATYMIVYKDGADTNLIGFTLKTGISSGTWTSPFTNPPFAVSGTKGVSHFTIFDRAEPTGVPEAATLALFGIGLATLVRSRRRKL